VSFLNKLLKFDHAMNEAAVLENLYFQWCTLNVNKIDIVTYFSELICQLLLICFQVHMCKISAEFLLNYSKLFLGLLCNPDTL